MINQDEIKGRVELVLYGLFTWIVILNAKSWIDTHYPLINQVYIGVGGIIAVMILGKIWRKK